MYSTLECLDLASDSSFLLMWITGYHGNGASNLEDLRRSPSYCLKCCGHLGIESANWSLSACLFLF